MILHVLRASKEKGLVVTIMYQKGDCITRRDIEVKSIEGGKVTAYCHLRKQTRTFKLENILAALSCGERNSEY